MLLHYTNFAKIADSISLLIKSKFPVNIFQIMVAIVYAFKILWETQKSVMFFPSYNVTQLLTL